VAANRLLEAVAAISLALAARDALRTGHCPARAAGDRRVVVVALAVLGRLALLLRLLGLSLRESHAELRGVHAAERQPAHAGGKHRETQGDYEDALPQRHCLFLPGSLVCWTSVESEHAGSIEPYSL
jgi:hypothetical protein